MRSAERATAAFSAKADRDPIRSSAAPDRSTCAAGGRAVSPVDAPLAAMVSAALPSRSVARVMPVAAV